MSGETALIPVDERKVDFYGDEITTALVKAEGQTQMYVPLRPICDYLGLSWPGQRERVNRDPVLSEEVRFVRVSRTARGGNPVVLSLPLEFLNGWLFGIMPSRVKSEVAFKLLCYRRECFNTLWLAFRSDWLVAFPEVGDVKVLSERASSGTGVFNPTYGHLAERVRDQCRRAEELDLPETLTVERWRSTLEYFGWYCAYCREKPGIVIEHFVPLSLGGGTTVYNCVPSCFACNSKKGAVILLAKF